MDPDQTDILVIVLSLIFSAFFSGVEIAFISSNRLKIELDKQKGTLNGRILGSFYQKEQQFIAMLLLGNNIALVVFGIYFAKLLNPVLETWGISSDALALLLQTVLSTLLVLAVAEFSPKAIFQLNPNGFLKALTLPIVLVYAALFIPTKAILFLSLQSLRLFRVEMNSSQKVFSKVDLEHYVQDLSNRINDEEEFGNEMQILQNALDFSKIRARDCMVPRLEIISISVDASIAEVNALFVKTGISKILVYRENVDNIIGYVHSFEMFNNPNAIHQILRPVPFVPEAIPGKELLELFTKNASSIAVVVDEYGGTSGVITIEDVIEEIFGDIEDEHDVEDWLEHQLSDTEFRFSARAEIDYLNETYKLRLPESDEYETLGGLIINELETIPTAGTEVRLADYLLHIESVSERRIEVVRLEIID